MKIKSTLTDDEIFASYNGEGDGDFEQIIELRGVADAAASKERERVIKVLKTSDAYKTLTSLRKSILLEELDNLNEN